MTFYGKLFLWGGILISATCIISLVGKVRLAYSLMENIGHGDLNRAIEIGLDFSANWFTYLFLSLGILLVIMSTYEKKKRKYTDVENAD